jgi:predicted DNA-binding transcriptional regulator AlpA
MRLLASEKLEIIGLVEQSHLPARRTLQMLGIKSSTFYRWYDRLIELPFVKERGAPRPLPWYKSRQDF